jgi:hypothetical protein
MKELHHRFGQGHSLNAWLDMMLDELARSGALQMQNEMLIDT